MVAALTAITTGIIGWALWTRRHTWRVKWETAGTVNVALMGVAGVLGSPALLIGSLLGTWLHHLTHVWNLQFYLAHLCVLGAMSAIVYSAVAKLSTDEELKPWFQKWIQIPTAVGALTITALFTLSSAETNRYPEFGTMPIPDPCLRAYWITLSILLTYLLGHGINAFIHLWEHQPSRPILAIYLTASGAGALTLLLRIASATDNNWETPAIMDTMTVTACLSVTGFTVGAAYSWINRVRHFTSHPGWAGLTTPRFRPRRGRRTMKHREDSGPQHMADGCENRS